MASNAYAAAQLLDKLNALAWVYSPGVGPDAQAALQEMANRITAAGNDIDLLTAVEVAWLVSQIEADQRAVDIISGNA